MNNAFHRQGIIKIRFKHFMLRLFNNQVTERTDVTISVVGMGDSTRPTGGWDVVSLTHGFDSPASETCDTAGAQLRRERSVDR